MNETFNLSALLPLLPHPFQEENSGSDLWARSYFGLFAHYIKISQYLLQQIVWYQTYLSLPPRLYWYSSLCFSFCSMPNKYNNLSDPQFVHVISVLQILSCMRANPAFSAQCCYLAHLVFFDPATSSLTELLLFLFLKICLLSFLFEPFSTKNHFFLNFWMCLS